MVQLTRRDAFAHLDQRRERNHRVVAPAHVNAFDVLGRVAPARFGLHDHVVLLRVALVARHVAPAEQGFDGLGDHFDADAQIGGLVAFNFDAQLGLVQPQIHIGRNDAGVFGDFVQNLAHHGVEILVAVRSLNHKIERALAKTLAQRRRRDRKSVHARQRVEFGLQLTRHVQRGALALVPIDSAVNDAALRHRRVADIGKNPVKFLERLADFFQRFGVAVGVVQRGAVGRGDVGQNHAPVFERRKFLFHAGQHQRNRHRAGQHDGQHQPARLQHKTFEALAEAGVFRLGLVARRDQPAQQSAVMA